MTTQKKVRITGRVVLVALLVLEIFLIVRDNTDPWGVIGVPLIAVFVFVSFVLIDGELAKKARKH